MKDLLLKAKQEIEIVMDVVYMSGHPLPPNLQPIFYNWITGNPKLFDDVTRTWCWNLFVSDLPYAKHGYRNG